MTSSVNNTPHTAAALLLNTTVIRYSLHSWLILATTVTAAMGCCSSSIDYGQEAASFELSEPQLDFDCEVRSVPGLILLLETFCVTLVLNPKPNKRYMWIFSHLLDWEAIEYAQRPQAPINFRQPVLLGFVALEASATCSLLCVRSRDKESWYGRNQCSVRGGVTWDLSSEAKPVMVSPRFKQAKTNVTIVP